MAEHFDHLIIGSGIAGLTAAETLRRRDARASILLLGAEPWPPYSRVMLADVVVGDRRPEELYLRPADFFANKNIAFRSGCRVTAVRPAQHAVDLDDGQSLTYGRLLIATGCRSRRLGVPGDDLPGVGYFHDLSEATALHEQLAAGTEVLVYGGGFIALELAVACHRRGNRVTVAMRGPGFFHRLAAHHGVEAITAELTAHDIAVKPQAGLTSLRPEGQRLAAVFADGSVIQADRVLAGVGLDPNVSFLEGSGLLVDGVLAVDDHLRVADDIFAAGDVAAAPDPVSGRRHASATWQNALAQGRLAALNMLGGNETLHLLVGHAIACFDLTVAFLGDPDFPGAESVVREYPDGAVARLHFNGGLLVGVVNVGKFHERVALANLLAVSQLLSKEARLRLADARQPITQACE